MVQKKIWNRLLCLVAPRSPWKWANFLFLILRSSYFITRSPAVNICLFIIYLSIPSENSIFNGQFSTNQPLAKETQICNTCSEKCMSHFPTLYRRKISSSTYKCLYMSIYRPFSWYAVYTLLYCTFKKSSPFLYNEYIMTPGTVINVYLYILLCVLEVLSICNIGSILWKLEKISLIFCIHSVSKKSCSYFENKLPHEFRQDFMDTQTYLMSTFYNIYIGRKKMSAGTEYSGLTLVWFRRDRKER